MNLLRFKQFAFIICLAVIVTVACDKKTDEHHDEIDIEMSYTPNPALVNTEIHIEFEPVSTTGDHVELSMVTCEIHMEGGVDEHELTLVKEATHTHYEGDWTFTASGTHELHFGYMHDDAMIEKEFTIVIVPQ